MTAKKMKKNIKPGLTIAIPAYCEGERLARTTEDAYRSASEVLDEFKIIIIDDGSTDNTKQVAEELCAKYSNVELISFEQNSGVGAAFKAALEASDMEYITVVPGDRAFEKQSLKDIFACVGLADMIISYRINPDVRSMRRRILSNLCTLQLRITTKCNLRDGHSLFVWPVKDVKKINIPVDYSYHLVSLVELLKIVNTYMEIPVRLTPKPDQSSGVMRLEVVTKLATSLSKLTIKSLFNTYKERPVEIKLSKRAF